MHIVIIGNGISGITAARHVRKLSTHKVTVISSETQHFFARTALMYLYMGHMSKQDITPYEPWFWEKNGISLRQGHVSQVDPSTRSVHLDDKSTVKYDRLIIASGSLSRTLDIPGQNLKGVQGLYSWQDLESMEINSAGLKHAVIVGGGLIGIEMAEMFLSRDIGVTLLVRESGYYGNILPREEADVVGREIRRHGVDLRLETELTEIIGDPNDGVSEVITNSGERIACGFVGITIGVSPRIEPFNTIVECDRGILVDDLLRTSVSHVFAAGDCVEMREPQAGRRAIEPVWYTGRIMGEVAAYNACGYQVDYEPGIWFNSAKFFDIEYQVYGDISPKLSDDHDTIYWEHENGNKSIRINFRKSDQAVTGFNLLGVRYRQEVCEKWIANHLPMTEVLPQLALANFDPEFSQQHESALLAEYNSKFNTNLKSGSARKLNAVLKFLNA